MDYQKAWNELRNELYGRLKIYVELNVLPERAQETSKTLYGMLCKEDRARGIDVEARHHAFERNLTPSNIISVYESVDR